MNTNYMEDLLGNKLDPIKPALSHIGLYISIIAYTAIGAKVRFFFLFYIEILMWTMHSGTF